jgi:succinyl-CoA synthetase beta subunit
MLLNESEGKSLLREHGIPSPLGRRVTNEVELAAAIEAVGMPLILKVQIPVGGRGKSGGVKVANSEAEAIAHFRTMIGSTIKDHQVSAVLVEQKADLAHERYVGMVVKDQGLQFMIGRTGGVEIEETAVSDPSSIAIVPLRPEQTTASEPFLNAFEAIGLPENLWSTYLGLCHRLATTVSSSDLVMAEINPLAELSDGTLLALDARVEVDDSALYRQPRIRELLGMADDGNGAQQSVLRRLSGDGEVALIGYGGGMALCVSDWLSAEGHLLGAAVDMDHAIAHGHTTEAFSSVLDQIEADRRIKVILINITASGKRIDQIAESLVPALESRRRGNATIPIVLSLHGNRGSAATALLDRAGFPNCRGLRDAIDTTLQHLP